MKNIISKIVTTDINRNQNEHLFTTQEQFQIRDFAKAAGKTDFFFDFDGNELQVSRKQFVEDVEDGKATGIHIQTTDNGTLKQVRISKNNGLVRLA